MPARICPVIIPGNVITPAADIWLMTAPRLIRMMR
jgi:hypothetical protein